MSSSFTCIFIKQGDIQKWTRLLGHEVTGTQIHFSGPCYNFHDDRKRILLISGQPESKTDECA